MKIPYLEPPGNYNPGYNEYKIRPKIPYLEPPGNYNR